MRNIANVDLKKTCDSNDCKLCLCKPMWCLECKISIKLFTHLMQNYELKLI